MSDDHKEIDKISGVETTGHEWDGLKELNNPAPRWWLTVFFVTVVWAIGYWFLFPAWPVPGGSTKGMLGWTEYTKLAHEQAEIRSRQAGYLERFENASLSDVMNEPDLYNFALAGGKALFKDNCATCHGTGAEGRKGYPNLNDDDWLWGGKLSEVEYTIRHGIRSISDETRISEMPAFGKGGMLATPDINATVDYVLTLSGAPAKDTQDQGAKLYQENCAVCHGVDGKGGRPVGAPNLTDKIWLYGGDRKTIFETVFYGRKGIMPTWQTRLDDNMIRMLAVYVHELGGGEADQPVDQLNVEDDQITVQR